MMTPSNRYLRFQTIDVNEPDVRASCSQCGKEFVAEPQAGESIENVLRRVRAEFEAHKCEGA